METQRGPWRVDIQIDHTETAAFVDWARFSRVTKPDFRVERLVLFGYVLLQKGLYLVGLYAQAKECVPGARV